jgi:hypothetical protein
MIRARMSRRRRPSSPGRRIGSGWASVAVRRRRLHRSRSNHLLLRREDPTSRSRWRRAPRGGDQDTTRGAGGGTGPATLPLINDARCLRCFVQPICLPDKVNRQRFATEAPSPRKIWPPRDESIHVVAQQEGTGIGVKAMVLKVSDKDGQVTREVPLANLESLALLGGIQISTHAVHALADRGVRSTTCRRQDD